MTASPDSATRKRNLRVLAVDDEAPFTRLLKLKLERTGPYDVYALSQGAETERAAEIWKPDIILLDFRMPDMDGGEVFKRLKSNPRLKHIPVILLTALASEDTPVEQSLGAGRVTLAKPVRFEVLEKAIHLLTRHSAKPEPSREMA